MRVFLAVRRTAVGAATLRTDGGASPPYSLPGSRQQAIVILSLQRITSVAPVSAVPARRAETHTGLYPGRLLQMRQNLRDHFRLFDARDHLELPAAAGAGIDLHAEHAFEELRRDHRDVAQGDRLVSCLIRALPCATHTSMCRRHRRTQLAVRRKHAMKPRQMHPRRMNTALSRLTRITSR